MLVKQVIATSLIVEDSELDCKASMERWQVLMPQGWGHFEEQEVMSTELLGEESLSGTQELIQFLAIGINPMYSWIPTIMDDFKVKYYLVTI